MPARGRCPDRRDLAAACEPADAGARVHATRAAAAPADLPAILRPPADAQLFLRLRAEGTQIYRCQKNPSGAWAFTLKAPDARLISDGCTEVGHHFAGPSWSLATDGSVVVGKKLAEAPGPAPSPGCCSRGRPPARAAP